MSNELYFLFFEDRIALESFAPVLRMNPERPRHYMHHTQLSNLPPIQMFFLIAVLFIGLAVYFYPAILAIKRNSMHKTAVVILNLFFGFTLIGWIVALILASKQPPQVVVVYNTPPPPR